MVKAFLLILQFFFDYSELVCLSLQVTMSMLWVSVCPSVHLSVRLSQEKRNFSTKNYRFWYLYIFLIKHDVEQKVMEIIFLISNFWIKCWKNWTLPQKVNLVQVNQWFSHRGWTSSLEFTFQSIYYNLHIYDVIQENLATEKKDFFFRISVSSSVFLCY